MRVTGYCPMGCGETLEIVVAAPLDRVLCGASGCPRPTAMEEIMADPQTEHIVGFDDNGFAIQHPLRERLEGGLFACSFHAWLRLQDGPPVKPGRYRARQQDDPVSPWLFEELATDA